MREAQKLVVHAASSREYSDQSKTASASIVAIYSEVRWRVEVGWAEGHGATAGTEAR